MPDKLFFALKHNIVIIYPIALSNASYSNCSKTPASFEKTDKALDPHCISEPCAISAIEKASDGFRF